MEMSEEKERAHPLDTISFPTTSTNIQKRQSYNKEPLSQLQPQKVEVVSSSLLNANCEIYASGSNNNCATDNCNGNNVISTVSEITSGHQTLMIRKNIKRVFMIQQHSLDSHHSENKEIQQKETTSKNNLIQRSRTTPNRKSSGIMGFKYGSRPVDSTVSFPIPPVFPKTCSLFDSTFNGGAYANSQEDQKLMEALQKVRRKLHQDYEFPEKLAHQEQQQQQQSTNQSINDFANLTDSGHSSEGTCTSSPFSNEHSAFKDSIFNFIEINDKYNNSTNSEENDADGKLYTRKQKKKNNNSATNSRKTSRIRFFRRRAKTNANINSRKNLEKENSGDKLPIKHWTIDGSKSISWKRKILETLSMAGGIHLAGTNAKGEKPSDHFGKLDREWEVVTVRELCRRLSLEDSLEPSELPLPEGALRSQVLDEFMIRQIVDILPPRAEGYPWVNIYSSEKHGFSLSTLYRKMSEWREEMSPVLLVIRDVGGHVFGAVTSSALLPSDHYYGTGDSCLLFRFTGEYPHTRELRTYNWTGDNQFFVNATKEFFSVGAGGGHCGLWLDADLNHGRSQKCSTFDNEPLAGGLDEDFVIQFVEAFGFSMT